MSQSTIFQAIRKDEYDPLHELLKDVRRALNRYNATNDGNIKINIKEVNYNEEREIVTIS